MSVRKMLAVFVVVASALSFGSALATPEPSAGCTAGQGAGGVMVYNTAPGTSGTVRVCNNGSTVPAPVKGAVTVSGDATAQNGTVDVDGDSNNVGPIGGSCTTGYDRAQVGSGGATFYNGATGSYSSRSAPKDAPTFLQSAGKDCGAPTP